MARRRVRQQQTVERKIYFYRADAGLDDAGRPLRFDPRPVLAHIQRLPWSTRGKYWIAGDGKITTCWVDQIEPLTRLRLGNIRRNDLPQLEQGGALGPLDLSEESGLAEATHVVFFGDSIVGSEFNFYGPRVSRLASYFAEKAQRVCPPVFFEPLLRQDVAEQLERLRDIRLMHLAIHRSYATTVARANRSLASAFNAAAEAGDAEEIDILLRPARYSRGWLSHELLRSVRQLARERGLREGARAFEVKGYDRATDSVEAVDILNDKLIVTKTIIRLDRRTRALDSADAYRAIEEAYAELRDHLLAAAGVAL
jgi:hypothetical protein